MMTNNYELMADVPLLNPDDDRLRYAPFAKELAQAICFSPNDECLVFALYGPWGNGKTTCLNFVVHYINELHNTKRPIIVKFNPWWFSGHGDLLGQFFREFSIAVGKHSKSKKLLKALADFTIICSQIPEPTGISKVIGKVAETIKIKKEKEAWEIRDEIKKHLVNLKKQIIVFIDDIDRLPPDEIKSVFRVIKAIADFPKTTYLVAFDKQIVANAISPNDSSYADDFLEKIIQVPIELPNPDLFQLKSLFFELAEEFFKNTSKDLWDDTYFVNVFKGGIDHFLQNIRDVKRFINVLKISYPFVENEVNLVDFIAISAIKTFNSSLYGLIQNNIEWFTNVNQWVPKEQEELESFHKAWLNDIPEKDKEAIKELVTRIFPKVQEALGGVHHGADFESKWRKQRRICNGDIFHVYFRLSLRPGDISYKEMKDIISSMKDASLFTKKLRRLAEQKRPDGKSRLKQFLDKIQDHTKEDIPIEHIPNCLNVLFNIGDEFIIPEDEEQGMFASLFGNEMQTGRIFFQLMERLEPKEKRFEIVKQAMEAGNAIYFIVNETRFLGSLLGKYGDKAKPKDEQLITLTQQKELEKVATNKINEAASTDRLIKTSLLYKVLAGWRIWEGDKKVKDWVSDKIDTDEGLLKFLSNFVSESHTQSVADKISTSQQRLDPDWIKPYVDPAFIIDRCRKILDNPPERQNDREKIAIQTFVKWYDLIADGKDPDDINK
jgi:predicted KAP-like P-loop ATPase